MWIHAHMCCHTLCPHTAESVFNRIDAGKLQGALENASMLGKLEQEGVATELLPGVAKDVQAEKNKPKEKQMKV